MPPASEAEVIAERESKVASIMERRRERERREAESVLDHIASGRLPANARGIRASVLQTTVFAPIKYVVHGYIVEGLTLMAGKPKLGKSWLALDLCVAVANGGYTLDIKCEAGDVLYCALEDNPRRMKSRMEAVCQFGPWPERLTFWHSDDLPRMDDGGLDALREWILYQPAPRLIVIDTLSFVRPAKTPISGTPAPSGP